MKISYIISKTFALLALLIILYGFVIPSVGFHGALERIKDGKVEEIPSFAYSLWNFYQKDRYASINTPQDAKNDLKKMIEISGEIGVVSLPLWNFSLEAPNYPKEAFPNGLPVFIHFDGLSGEVHEMNTINHYVGMARMERGGVYERSLAPYTLIALTILLASFVIYNNKWISRLMIIPAVLPLAFVGIYGYWLYWFGHNLQGGAITIKPFMPVILGDGKVAQFTTHAYPVVGFWALVAVSVLSLFAWWLGSKALQDEKTTPLQHIFMTIVLIVGISLGVYVLKTDIKVDTLGKISALIDASKPKMPIQEVAKEPTKIEKEAIQKQLEDERKEQYSKIKALEQRAGSASKFKVSQLYKSNCAPCHGVNGEGNIGSKLVGLAKDEILKKILQFKTENEEMHSAVIDSISKEDMEQIANEIDQFSRH